MNYQQHPLSAAFPAMSMDDFQALKDSIAKVGVLNPITIYKGQVIDGWHRYQAAQQLGLPCSLVELGEQTDPRHFVLAQNRARRHITASQLALATTTVNQWAPAHITRRVAGPATQTKTNAEMAEEAGVSVKSIRQAKVVQSEASPEVVEAVKAGKIGLEKAAAIAKLPKAEQAAAISKPAPRLKSVAVAEVELGSAGQKSTLAPVDQLKPDLEPVPSPGGLTETEAFEQVIRDYQTALEDNAMMGRVFDAADKVKEAWVVVEELRALVKQRDAEIATLRERLYGLMNEKNVLITSVKSLKRQVAKLELRAA